MPVRAGKGAAVPFRVSGQGLPRDGADRAPKPGSNRDGTGFLPATGRPGAAKTGGNPMAEDQPKPSEVDAMPDAGSPAPKPPEPGQHPRTAETEAQPDRPVPNDGAGA